MGDDVVASDPLAKLGFGIVAYIDMLWTLIWTFTLFSIMLLPTMMFFADGGAYNDVPAAVKSDYLDTYLGSMGYSSVQCAQIPTSLGKLSLSCPYGTIGGVLSHGVNVAGADSNPKTCLDPLGAAGACKPFNASLAAQMADSVGQKTSVLEWSSILGGLPGTSGPGCTLDSTVFVQYTCVQDAASQAEQFNHLAVAVATSALIALLFSVSIRKMYQGGKI